MLGINSSAQFQYQTPGLRPAVLDLADRFDSAQGWGLERIFADWVMKQSFRGALPPVRKKLVFQKRSRASD